MLFRSLAEYEVEEILRVKNAVGKGKRQALVKWKGWKDPTWVPFENVKDTAALDVFETLYGDAKRYDGPLRVRK